VLGSPVLILRYSFWFLGNLIRRIKKPPNYVVFVLEGEYPDLRRPRARFLQKRLFPDLRISLEELGERFRAVEYDHRVAGVVIHLGNLKISMAQAQTVRDFIGRLQSAGKRTVAWSSSYDNTRYYVAAAADEILLQTGGEAAPVGLRTTFTFLADSLDKIGVKADFVQISPYKSAADSLMRRSLSEEAREMSNWLLDAYYEDFIQAVASGRRLEYDEAKALVDGAPYTDLRAVEAQVVDRLISEEDLPSYLGTEDKPARLATWEATRRQLLLPPLSPRGRHVALIRIEGPIVDGWSQQPPFKSPLPVPMVSGPRSGDLTVVQQARRVLTDKRTAAVLLYVDSPGGSASASEAISAALQKVADKKPLVAAMGSTAASGGYYVCTPANWISAQPGTLTGSIGVLSGKVITGGLWDKLMLHREHIDRGLHSDFQTSERPFSDEERKIVWDSIQRVYDVFLSRVMSGRNLSRDTAESVAGGRVWTGHQALHLGLVDGLGGLDAGFAKARELAGLDPRAPVREIATGRAEMPPPVPDPAGFISYVLEGLEMFTGGKALLLCDLYDMDAGCYL